MTAPPHQSGDDSTKEEERQARRRRREARQGLAFLAQVGFTMASCVIVGVFIGRFVDSYFSTTPWGIVLFSLLGVGASFKSLYDLSIGK